jgi:magnesium transporter
MSVPTELAERLRLELEEPPDAFAARLADLSPVDVAEVLNRLRVADAAAVLGVLPVPRAVEVFDQPALRRRGALLARLEVERAAEVLAGLSADERTDVAREMGEHGRRRLLPKLAADIRAEVERLLRYPDQSAGGIMTTEFVRLDPAMTVGEALKHIRSVAGEKETIYACYVPDPASGRLLGAVSLRDLVMAELDQPVVDVMRRRPVTVDALEDRESVAHKIAKYNLLAVPVLERDGSVVGFVTVDDVVDVMIEEQTEDMYHMAGVGVQERATSPTLESARRRVPWLGFNMAWSLGSALVVSFFQPTIEAAAVLVVFMPVIAGQAGNAGIQTATIVIRSLALGEVTSRDTMGVLIREWGVGLIKGGTFGLALGLIAWLWKGSAMLGVVAGVSLFLNIAIVASSTGVLLPMALSWMGRDPATIAGVFDTMLSDLMGNLIYLGLATLLIRWLV